MDKKSIITIIVRTFLYILFVAIGIGLLRMEIKCGLMQATLGLPGYSLESSSECLLKNLPKNLSEFLSEYLPKNSPESSSECLPECLPKCLFEPTEESGNSSKKNNFFQSAIYAFLLTFFLIFYNWLLKNWDTTKQLEYSSKQQTETILLHALTLLFREGSSEAATLARLNGLKELLILKRDNPDKVVQKRIDHITSSGLKFAGANLIGVDLSHAALDGATLDGVDLSGAKLDGANLKNAKLDGATLDEADLSGAILDGATLIEANLSRAKLNGAKLNGTNLKNAKLDGATFKNAKLEGANLSHEKSGSEKLGKA